MILVWSFTWFSYWLFFKNQVDALNIVGTATSAGLIAFMRFSPIRVVTSKALKLATPQIGKSINLPHATRTTLIAQTSRRTQPYPATVFPKNQAPCAAIKIQKAPIQAPPVQATTFEPRKEENQSTKPIEKSANLGSDSNGCPKNLEYYTKKPRPKQVPEECINCKNLIRCVCLTNN